jgi:hypothetical protein
MKKEGLRAYHSIKNKNKIQVLNNQSKQGSCSMLSATQENEDSKIFGSA